MKKNGVPENIDEYIAQCPQHFQSKLRQIRNVISKNAPGAEERISYQMPAFFLNGILVYFAAQKNHIGLYPGSEGVAAFKEELAGYKTGKGSIQFPADKPLPLGLIREIVKFRVIKNLQKPLRRSK